MDPVEEPATPEHQEAAPAIEDGEAAADPAGDDAGSGGYTPLNEEPPEEVEEHASETALPEADAASLMRVRRNRLRRRMPECSRSRTEYFVPGVPGGATSEISSWMMFLAQSREDWNSPSRSQMHEGLTVHAMMGAAEEGVHPGK